MSKALASYRDLKVWNEAMELVENIYTVARLLPEEERFGLIVQMRRAAVSIPSSIAEGYGRADQGDYRRHLSFANGSLKELETQLLIAGRLKFIEKQDACAAWESAQIVGKMPNRLMASLTKP